MAGWAPPGGGGEYGAVVAQLRGSVVPSDDAAAVSSALDWHALVAAGEFRLPAKGKTAGVLQAWLTQRKTACAGVPPTASCLYDAVARALFGANSALAPKLRWLGAEFMRRNKPLFEAEAEELYEAYYLLPGAHERVTQPGDAMSLRALVGALGFSARVVTLGLDGFVRCAQVDPVAGPAARLVALCVTEAAHAKPDRYDLLAPPPPPTPGGLAAAASSFGTAFRPVCNVVTFRGTEYAFDELRLNEYGLGGKLLEDQGSGPQWLFVKLNAQQSAFNLYVRLNKQGDTQKQTQTLPVQRGSSAEQPPLKRTRIAAPEPAPLPAPALQAPVAPAPLAAAQVLLPAPRVPQPAPAPLPVPAPVHAPAPADVPSAAEDMDAVFQPTYGWSDEESDDSDVTAAAAALAEELGGLDGLDAAAWSGKLQREGKLATARAMVKAARAILAGYEHAQADDSNVASGSGSSANAADAVIADATRELETTEELLRELDSARKALIVGSEGAGKSSLVSRICQFVMALDAELARINGGAGGDGNKRVEEVTRWDDDGACVDAWFSDETDKRDDAAMRKEMRHFNQDKREVLPASAKSTTTAICTTVVLAPGLQPRIVFKYKSAAELCKLRRAVDAVRAHNWQTGTEDFELEGSETPPLPPPPPPRAEFWSDYAIAAFGVTNKGAQRGTAGVEVLTVAAYTAEDMQLPVRFKALLGATRTVRFLHTDRGSLVLAVSNELLRHTLGTWSHWGLLESVRVYLPSEPALVPKQLLLVDVPGYNKLSEFRRESQQSAFKSGAFSTVLHVIKKRDDKTFNPYMLQDTEMRNRVFFPLTQPNCNFGVISLYSLDCALKRGIDNWAAVSGDFEELYGYAESYIEDGEERTTGVWRAGLTEFLEKIMHVPTADASNQVDAIMGTAGLFSPMVVNADPALFDTAIANYVAQHGARPAEEGALAQRHLSTLLERVNANAAEFEAKAVAAALERLMSGVVRPLLSHAGQLDGFRHLGASARAALQEKVTQTWRATVRKALQAQLDAAFTSNEKPALDIVRGVMDTAARNFNAGCTTNAVTERYKDAEFVRYHRGSHKLLPDMLSTTPQATLLPQLLFGNECAAAVVGVAACARAKLPGLFITGGAGRTVKKTSKAAALESGSPGAATGTATAAGRGTQTTFDTVNATLCRMLIAQLTQHAAGGADDKLDKLVQLTTERFGTDLKREVDNCRDLVTHALDINSLTACLEGSGGIVETVMLEALARKDVTKRRTNELRVKAMASQVSIDCGVSIAQQLRVHVRQQLAWVQNRFMERALRTCDKALEDLARCDEAGQLYLTRSDVRSSTTLLASRLSNLAAAMLDARDELRLDCDSMGVTDEFAQLVRLRASVPLLAAPDPSPESEVQDEQAARAQAAREAAAIDLGEKELHGDGLARECSGCRNGNFSKGSFNVVGRLVCHRCFFRHKRTGIL